MTRPLILDCDTGTDDAIAIMLAALSPETDLVGVTTVWGNTDVEATTENTLRVLRLVGHEEVPVVPGAAGPSSPPPGHRETHASGDYLDLPPATVPSRPGPAADWIIETLRAATEPMTLVLTGPLTNIATALALDPAIGDTVDEVVIMGGTHERPGITPSAERNFWNDAAAARTVLDAGLRRVVLVVLDATYAAALGHEHATALAELATPPSTAAATLLEQRISDYRSVPDLAERHAAPVHDALAVAYVVQPQLLRLRHLHVAVEQGGPAHGRSLIDVERTGPGTPNVHVALEADREGYADLLLRTFAHSPDAGPR